MTKIVDVHVFDSHVQSNINEKYNNTFFNGEFDIEFKKWVDFLGKLFTENNVDDKKIKKIYEMLRQLNVYKDKVNVPNTNVKIATLFQKIMYLLQYHYMNDKNKFEVIWGYFIEFYSEELSTHCPEGVSNRAYFILELSKDYI